MYLILIAWLYVVMMFSVAQNDLSHTVFFLVFLGILPVWGCVWIVHRRRMIKTRIAQEAAGDRST